MATLLLTFDTRSEESWKIYDLLLAFCRVNELKLHVCSAIVRMPISEKRLSTPSLAMCRAGSQSLEEAINPEVPLNAIRLLNYMCKEAVEQGVRIQELVPLDLICNLVESCIKTVLETKSALIVFQCARIIEGLRLAEGKPPIRVFIDCLILVVSNDEDVRRELLEVVNAPLCAHINESQLISNPIVNFVNRLGNGVALRAVSIEDLPEWR